jgi:hypothetical protein
MWIACKERNCGSVKPFLSTLVLMVEAAFVSEHYLLLKHAGLLEGSSDYSRPLDNLLGTGLFTFYSD